MSKSRGGRPAPLPRPDDSPVRSVPVNSLPYYHPHLTNMEQVKQLLCQYSHVEGCFILRNSMSKPGYYTISVMHSSGIKHFNVEMTAAPTYFLKDIQFKTVDQLIQFYREEEVPNKEQIRNVRLRFPITRDGLMSQQTKSKSKYVDLTSDSGLYIHTEPSHDAMIRRSSDTMPSRYPKLSVTRRSRTSDDSNHYDYAEIPPEADCVPHVMKLMNRLHTSDEGKRCDCGLLEEDAILPRGWSVHLSRDVNTFGEIYFMSPEGKTQWTLPLAVSLELTADQQDRIRDLIWDFEQQTHRTARAKMADGPSSSSSSLQPSSPTPVQTAACFKPADTDDTYIGPNPVVAASSSARGASPRLDCSAATGTPAAAATVVHAALGGRSSLYPVSPTASDAPDLQTKTDSDYMPMSGVHLTRF